jgi:protein kinase X
VNVLKCRWSVGCLFFDVYRKIFEQKLKFPSVFNSTAKSAVSDLLKKNRANRLGCGRGGFQSLKSHSYFRGISWDSANNQQLQPIIVPSVISDGDSSNFDYYPEEQSEVTANLTADERDMFKEFDIILERFSSA